MGEFVWPCPDYTRVTSPFGPRWGDLHSGVDLGASTGTPIIAAKSGKVISNSIHESYGNHLKIDHGGGTFTLYAHADELYVSVGDHVKAGQTIAAVGNTGNSTGPHLHFEIYLDGSVVNPENYVKPEDTITTHAGSTLADKLNELSGHESEAKSEKKEITEVVVKSTKGEAAAHKFTALRSQAAVLARGCEILIQASGSTIYQPVVEGDISLEYERKGSPGKLTFNVIKEGALSFHEGNPVSFRVDGEKIFYGYVFTKKRNKNNIITVTCYDQLRYFKNKDTLIYRDKKYSELLKQLADSYKLTCGTIEDTGYVIAGRIEDGTLYDILGNAADETVLNTGEMFVLYDDCGEICLKNIKNMIVPILIDRDTAENYDYTSSIDEESYNRVVLSQDNDITGERELYIANDPTNQSLWGILQYYESAGSAGSSGTGSGGGGAPAGMSTENRRMSQTGIDMVKEYEGLYLYAYDDGVGVVTIGYGHTGGDVYWGLTISEQQAEAWLKEDMQEFEAVVNSMVNVPITQNMFDALVSFSFNVGDGALGSSDLLAKLNQGDYRGAAEEFGRWVHGGGQVMGGLVRRRESEKQLFLTGMPGTDTTRAEPDETAGDSDALLNEKAKLLLEYYNKKTRSLQISGCFGDIRVRGGSTVAVNMDIGDLVLSNYMVVERVKHTFKHMAHTMNLTVVGVRGEFI